jgi:hypothetical protein
MENDEIDTQTGGEDLSISQAAAAYAKATATPVSNDHGNADEQDDSDTTTDDDLPDGDEPESDETDGETDTEEDTAEDADGEPETEQGRFVADNAKVRLADGTVTSVHELKRGFLRESDYTRKTTEAAEQRKQFEAQSSTLKASQEQLEQERALAIQVIQSAIGEPPPLSMLDPTSPDFDIIGYNQRKANHDAWAQHLYALQQQDQQSRQKKTEEATRTEVEKANKEWSILSDKLTYLRDSKKAEAFANDLKAYLTGPDYGFAPEEMKAVALDHRFAVIADKARRWDKLQASKANVAKKVEGRPPVQKGGKRLNPSEHRSRSANDAFAKAKQSGSLEDVTAAFIASLNKG